MCKYLKSRPKLFFQLEQKEERQNYLQFLVITCFSDIVIGLKHFSPFMIAAETFQVGAPPSVAFKVHPAQVQNQKQVFTVSIMSF